MRFIPIIQMKKLRLLDHGGLKLRPVVRPLGGCLFAQPQCSLSHPCTQHLYE
jgi:hypothetical protein